jgi:hypothetical protein
MMPVLRSTDIALVILKLPEHFYIENVCEIFKEIVWGVKKTELAGSRIRFVLERTKFSTPLCIQLYTSTSSRGVNPGTGTHAFGAVGGYVYTMVRP